ncbi:MAG TPA: 50S ribosomal protein L29 [Terriglobales bacterium]|nr:50S ribosomal protein L29 [Terriglobales bacterium]
MNIEKIRNLGPEELLHQQREAADQLFRLKFQLKMGQTAGVKKMRELRKDLARIKTIARERELGITTSTVGNATTGAAVAPKQETAPAAVVPPTPKKSSRAVAKKKSAAAKKKTSAAPKKKAAAKKSKAKK